MLWHWAKQRADNMSSIPNTMSKPRAICVLGRIPPNRKSERDYGKEGFQWRPKPDLSIEHRAARKS